MSLLGLSLFGLSLPQPPRRDCCASNFRFQVRRHVVPMSAATGHAGLRQARLSMFDGEQTAWLPRRQNTLAGCPPGAGRESELNSRSRCSDF